MQFLYIFLPAFGVFSTFHFNQRDGSLLTSQGYCILNFSNDQSCCTTFHVLICQWYNLFNKIFAHTFSPFSNRIWFSSKILSFEFFYLLKFSTLSNTGIAIFCLHLSFNPFIKFFHEPEVLKFDEL